MPHKTTIPLINNQLPYNLRGYQNTYVILIKYPHKNLTVHYETTISFLKYTTTNTYILQLHRSQVMINNKLPANKLYVMANEMAAAIYPVCIEINKENKITAITNHQNIIERSNAIVAKLSTYFEGTAANDCLSLFKNHCSNPNLLIAGLQHDFFYSIFFLPIHTEYDQQFKASFETELILGSNKNLYSITIQLTNTYNEKDKVVADVTGICENAKFTAQYQLYADDHTIYSIIGFANYIDQENKPAEIEFEVYHLNEEERDVKGKTSFKKIINSSEHNRQSLIIGVTEKPIKKSIWSFFSK